MTESASHSTLNATADFVSKSQIAVVRYAYVTIGSIVLVASALYAAAYCQDHLAKRNASKQHQQTPMTHQTTHGEVGTEVSDRKPAERQRREKYVYSLTLLSG